MLYPGIPGCIRWVSLVKIMILQVSSLSIPAILPPVSIDSCWTEKRVESTAVSALQIRESNLAHIETLLI